MTREIMKLLTNDVLTKKVVTPKVSVIIPAYNHEKFIAKAIDSVLEQDYANFELLISDDCSSDRTREVISSITDSRIHVFFQERNLGPVFAIDFLCHQAKGEFIALLNSDDYWLPGKLSAQVEYMDSHPETAICFAQSDIVSEDDILLTIKDVPYADVFRQPNRTQGQWLRFFWAHRNALCHPSILARRRIYAEEFLLNPAFRQLPDFDLWTRIVQKYPIHILQKAFVAHRRTFDESRNTSAVTEDNLIRDMNEGTWICYRMICDMPDELLIESFEDIFIYPKAKNRVELLCERFFLLERRSRYEDSFQCYAQQFFFANVREESFVRCLEFTYGYTLRDFFKETGSSGFGALSIRFQTSERQRISMGLRWETKQFIIRIKKKIIGG